MFVFSRHGYQNVVEDLIVLLMFTSEMYFLLYVYGTFLSFIFFAIVSLDIIKANLHPPSYVFIIYVWCFLYEVF